MTRMLFHAVAASAIVALLVGCSPPLEPGEGPLGVPRTELGGATLADGRMVVVGGRSELYGDELASVEIRAVDGTWLAGPSLTAGVSNPGVAALPDGRVLIAGGTRDGAPVADAWLSDPALTRFDPVTLPEPRAEHAIVVAGEAALVIGGVDGSGEPVSTVFRFDAGAGTWSSAAPMETARAGAAAFVLGDGRVIVIGGRSRTAAQASTELLAADGLSWSAGPRMLVARHDFAAAIDENDNIGVVGGVGAQGHLESGEMLSSDASAWSAWARQPDVAIGSCLAASGGRWWLMGGMRPVTSYAGIVRETLLVAEPGWTGFEEVGRLREGRYQPYCALLSDGSVVLIGGSTSRMRGMSSTDVIPLRSSMP